MDWGNESSDLTKIQIIGLKTFQGPEDFLLSERSRFASEPVEILHEHCDFSFERGQFHGDSTLRLGTQGNEKQQGVLIGSKGNYGMD